MAPFLPGDYIEFAGITSDSTLICYSVVAANVQILTTSVPAYIRVEDAIVGVFDGTSGEFADTRVRIPFLHTSAIPRLTLRA
jgi:hypothetical protein